MAQLTKIKLEQREVVVEQFVSKYPFKQRLPANVIFRGSIYNLTEEAETILAKVDEVSDETKFVIIYFK